MSPRTAYPLLLVLSLILLAAVGFGPSLHLVSRQQKRRVSTALLISPAVGLVVMALITYPIFLNSIPLDQVVVPITLLPFGFSFGLLIVDLRTRRRDYSDLLSKSIGVYLAAFAIVFFLLIIPVSIGGDHYRYWQGNAYDAMNYWTVTYFVQHIPLREVSNPSALQSTVQINPALVVPLSTTALFTRAVVEQPLAWLCLLFNAPVYEFYYYFKLLGVAITFFSALAVAERLLLPIMYRLGLVTALTLGFWSWYVLDTDALSHIYAIPLGMLFLFT